MAEKKAPNNVGNAAAGIAAAAALLQYAEPVVKFAVKRIDGAIEEQKMLVTVPNLCHKEDRFTAEKAIADLESRGFKTTLVEINVADARVRYKDCIDSQVVSTVPRGNKKVKPGETVIVKYVTKAVIDESLRIYEQSEQRKAEQKEKARQTMSHALAAVKQETSKVQGAILKKKNKSIDPPSEEQ